LARTYQLIELKRTYHKEYFCLCNLLGYNSKNKHLINYPNVAFVTICICPLLVTLLNDFPTPPAMINKYEEEPIFEDASNDENFVTYDYDY